MQLVFLLMFVLSSSAVQSKYIVAKQSKWLPLHYRPYLAVDEEENGGVNVFFGFHDHAEEFSVLLHANGDQKHEIYMEMNVTECSDSDTYKLGFEQLDISAIVVDYNESNIHSMTVGSDSFSFDDNLIRFKLNAFGHVDVLNETGAVLETFEITTQAKKLLISAFFENLYTPMNDINETNFSVLWFKSENKCNATLRIYLDTNKISQLVILFPSYSFQAEQVYPLIELTSSPYSQSVLFIPYKTETYIDAECHIAVACTLTVTSLIMIMIGTWMYLHYKRIEKEILHR